VSKARIVFEAIRVEIDALRENPDYQPQIYFVDAPGGTGKTFLMNAILSYVRSLSLIAVPTGYSGIAAGLLTGGRTCHSIFSLPVNNTGDGTSSKPCQL